MSVDMSGFMGRNKLIPIILIIAGLLMSFHGPIFSLISPAKLELQIQHQPLIMPSVYKVYANDNAMDGKFSLFKMLVTNNSSNKAKNIEVSYQIPNYIEWKSIVKIPEILPGESVVVNCYPTFPDKIVEKTTSSKEQVNIKVTGSNISESDENFGIDIKGRNEFMYSCIPSDEIRTASEYFDNMPLLTCFVTPEDPIIKYYTQKIQEKVLKGEEASVGNQDKEGVRFLTGIYYATLISHMVYSGTSGVPSKIDDVSSLIQSIRLPREVITGKTGLCIELSLLYASIMMNAGMNPIIYLIPGHAYPGFKMNGNYYAIEATGIGGEGLGGRMTTDQALQTGMKNLNEFIKMASEGDDRYRIVDVRDCINKGAVAMELKDDSYLRQKIDEITQSFDNNGASTRQQVSQTQQEATNETTTETTNTNTPNGYKLYNGVPQFSYPASWHNLRKNSSTMPQIAAMMINSSKNAYLEVYQFSGYTDPQQAMIAIKNYVNRYGATLQYRLAGTTDAGYQIFNGQTAFNGQYLNWMAGFKAINGGVVGIAAGAYSTTGTRYQSTILQILNSLK